MSVIVIYVDRIEIAFGFDATFHGLVWLPVNTSRYCVISLRAVLHCAVENLVMSFKLHIFTHDQDIVQIPSKVSIIVYNMI